MQCIMFPDVEIVVWSHRKVLSIITLIYLEMPLADTSNNKRIATEARREMTYISTSRITVFMHIA